MSDFTRKHVLFFLLLALTLPAGATTVRGTITDKKNDPLPFVNVYVQGTTRGTTSNVNGEYSIEVQQGIYCPLVFKMIGYKQEVIILETTDAEMTLNVSLSPEMITYAGVDIRADAEDPAYAVIRQAIKKRKFYLEQVEAYSCDVYIKGLQRMKKFPKKFMGEEVNDDGWIDTTSGIFYLSESVSKFNFKQKDKIHEEMISSKVSGDNRAFSYNQASEMLFNFYQNLMEVQQLTDRGFVSPISANAFIYYRYKLLGTFYENGQMINKIQVIPKRKSDPVFRGEIYIAENTWRIHSLDLMLTKEAQIDFVDTLVIHQVHLPVDKDTWMPFSNKFTFKFSFLGFKGNGYFTGVHSNYLLDPDFPKGYFKGEEMKVLEDANKKDSVYWKETRPVPLTAEEIGDYRKKDSLERLRNSKPYLDSLDRKTNKFRFGNLLTGYTYDKRFRKESYDFSSMLRNVNFNTVQGLNCGMNVTYNKELEKKKRRLLVSTDVNYGFANEKLYSQMRVKYWYRPQRFEWGEINFGHETRQFNGKEPISEFLNTVYTLVQEQNFMKIYQRSFCGLTHNVELWNGVILNTNLEYSDRSPLVNNSDFKLVNIIGRRYTSNDPLFAESELYHFKAHQALNLNVSLTLRYRQKYYTRPNEKFILGSKYPTLTLVYKRSIPGWLGSDMDYSIARATLSDRLNLKLLGKSSYSVSAGKFLHANKMGFMDFYHFMGNRTHFSLFSPDQFQLLDYYSHSTNDYFIQGYYEHNFAGFILNKLPLIRKLKLDEMAAVKFLMTENTDRYLELSIGLQRLFVRADFVASLSENNAWKPGVRFGLLIN